MELRRRKVYTRGDLVFAQATGFKHWPAVIAQVPNAERPYYVVNFFGSRQEGHVTSRHIVIYNEENRKKYGLRAGKRFEQAMGEIMEAHGDRFSESSVFGDSTLKALASFISTPEAASFDAIETSERSQRAKAPPTHTPDRRSPDITDLPWKTVKRFPGPANATTSTCGVTRACNPSPTGVEQQESVPISNSTTSSVIEDVEPITSTQQLMEYVEVFLEQVFMDGPNFLVNVLSVGPKKLTIASMFDFAKITKEVRTWVQTLDGLDIELIFGSDFLSQPEGEQRQLWEKVTVLNILDLIEELTECSRRKNIVLNRCANSICSSDIAETNKREEFYGEYEDLWFEGRIIEIIRGILGHLDNKQDDCNCDEVIIKFEELEHIETNQFVLVKHPFVLHTLQKLRSYVGNYKNWNLTKEHTELFKSQTRIIRQKSCHFYSKYKNMFSIPPEMTFTGWFNEEVKSFNERNDNKIANIEAFLLS